MSSHCDTLQDSSSAEKHSVCETPPIQCVQREEDVQPPPAMVPFSFFRFPLDIRIIIYEELFRMPFADKTITPDPSYRRRHLGRRYAERTVKYDLGLLQSCQQAHQEATAVLYGSKAFFFDDTSYGFEDTKIEASNYCWYCLGERGMPQGSPSSIATENRCLDAYNGKHYLKIPHCDFVDMYDWLLKIGPRNRIQIKHVQICFSGSQFAQVLGEQRLAHDPLKPSPVGGHLIERALALLARGHNLNTFSVLFRHRYLDLSDTEDGAMTGTWTQNTNAALNWTAFERLFSNGLDHRLKNALSNIKGIRMLDCDLDSVTPQPSGSWSDEGAQALEGFKQVKACMEAGYADHQRVKTFERTLSTPFDDLSGAAIHDRKSVAAISLSDGALERSLELTNRPRNISFARQCRPLASNSPPLAADFLLFKGL